MASNLNADLQRHTGLFPCSANVHIPYYEAENFRVKAALGSSKVPSHFLLSTVTQDVKPASEKYIKMISNNLTFTEDVIENRCLHMMPYSEKYFQGIFEPGKLISSRMQTKRQSRYKTRNQHENCVPHYQSTVIKPYQVTPLKKMVKSQENQLHRPVQVASKSIEEAKNSQYVLPLDSSSTLFMTEIGSMGTFPKINNDSVQTIYANNLAEKSTVKSSNVRNETYEQIAPMSQNVKASIEEPKLSILPDISEERQNNLKLQKRDWDDHLLSKLSQLTANWIVHACTPEDGQKEKLANELTSWYGHSRHTDLVTEEINDTEEDDQHRDQKHKKEWKKNEPSRILAKVYNVTPPPAAAIDPYSDDNQAPFYRQPTGIRKMKRNQDKEEAGAINTTAHNIQIRDHVQAPLPKLKDFLNPKVGDKIYETDNLYQQEWLTGKSHIFNDGGNQDEIKIESGNKYRKQLQPEMPLKPDVWYTPDDSDHTQQQGSFRKRYVPKPKKGWKRWTDLPQPASDAEQLMVTESSEINHKTVKTTDSRQRQRIRQNHALVAIVHDWRSRWFMSGQYADSTPDDLIRDMADIQPHVRLKAIGTLAKAAEYSSDDSKDNVSAQELPEKIFIALECLLDDSHQQVRKAAAVTMYSLGRPSDKAEGILKKMLASDNEADRWASVQCLSHYGSSDSDVVTEILKQILSTESAIKYEQGIHLLSRISATTNIVHCIVAEQLNSSNWRHRVIACKILPTLCGSINRDITHKLLELMWHDWHAEVRNAAAQCLGKTSHGQDVHNSIIEQLLHGTERTKLEAISKLGQLGIMTAKLLPAFLQCFASHFVSIRCEVCITCGNLQINEEQAVQQLLLLATSDPSWRVKALAIQALGKIGTVNNDVKECLFWALRYEDNSGVRAEACHSIVALNIRDEDIIETLQERLLVESSGIVRKEIAEALIQFGVSATDDTEMVAQIKSEICRLSDHNIVASEIMVNEADDSKQAQLKKIVYLTEEDIEALNKRKALMLQHIQSQANIKKHRPSSKSKMATPLASTTPEPFSREGSEFTQAADKELEALLGHRSESCSLSSKSRPATKQSFISDEEEKSRSGEEPEENYPVVQAETDDEERKSYTSGRETGLSEFDEETQKPAKLSLPPLIHPTFGKNIVSPYSKPASGILLNSRLSPVHIHSHRSVKDVDSLKEEDRFNQEVSTIFSDLHVRYAYLIEDLMKIDKGYNTRESLSTGDLEIFVSGEEFQLNETMTTVPNNDTLETVTQEGLSESNAACIETQEVTD
ncbi:unnamed protein product [Candidula unifasciata]|uniref:HEAT repeat-containing protein 4 n=1 Tax=Candidula unifasciata TaxID=100452 RepID=A0A8S3YVS6_9EUPU|nr:unnamed protein product [Candidula unifasciata]